VSRPVHFGVKQHLVPKTRFLLLSDSFRFVAGLQFYASAFCIVSLQESGSLWTPTVYGFTCNSSIYICTIYRVLQEKRSAFWEIIVSVILSKKVYVYICPIPNSFRDSAILLYSSKIEILCAVSDTGIVQVTKLVQFT
jgi:hypothetical protein